MPPSPEATRHRGARGGTRSNGKPTHAILTNNNNDSSDSSDYDSSSDSSTSSQFTNSLLPATSLYPPFYNRPPTPLPPSPSLTSLLLPHRTQSSSTHHHSNNTYSAPTSPRHTPLHSPDHSPSASDTESHPPPPGGGGGTTLSTQTSASNLATDSSLAASSAFATLTPRASPRVPTYEYYGFVLYLISTAAFGMYILWSYLPAPMLHAIGIHYYPSRWWSLALPSWLVVAVGWIYAALAGYNTAYLTKGLGSVEVVVDGVARIASVESMEKRERGEGKERDWKKLWNKGTDGVIDIPIGGVCEVLYGDGRELEDWEMDSGEGEEWEARSGSMIIGAETGDFNTPVWSSPWASRHLNASERVSLDGTPAAEEDHGGDGRPWGRSGSVQSCSRLGDDKAPEKAGKKSRKRGSTKQVAR